jgi:hypothetical protein
MPLGGAWGQRPPHTPEIESATSPRFWNALANARSRKTTVSSKTPSPILAALKGNGQVARLQSTGRVDHAAKPALTCLQGEACMTPSDPVRCSCRCALLCLNSQFMRSGAGGRDLRARPVALARSAITAHTASTEEAVAPTADGQEMALSQWVCLTAVGAGAQGRSRLGTGRASGRRCQKTQQIASHHQNQRPLLPRLPNLRRTGRRHQSMMLSRPWRMRKRPSKRVRKAQPSYLAPDRDVQHHRGSA